MEEVRCRDEEEERGGEGRRGGKEGEGMRGGGEGGLGDGGGGGILVETVLGEEAVVEEVRMSGEGVV